MNEFRSKEGTLIQQNFFFEKVHNFKLYYIDIDPFHGRNLRLLEIDGFG